MTDLYPDIVRNLVVLDEAANKLEIGVACSRVRNLYLLNTTTDKLPEESGLLVDGHRVGQSLIAIPQVG